MPILLCVALPAARIFNRKPRQILTFSYAHYSSDLRKRKSWFEHSTISCGKADLPAFNMQL
jgi:hypothetical protein